MDQSAISVLNCTFSGNSASLLGGALYRSSTTHSSDVRGCSFLKNSAGQFGGAIYEQMIDSGSIKVCRRTVTQLEGQCNWWPSCRIARAWQAKELPNLVVTFQRRIIGKLAGTAM